jgi:PAS domain S-box-containing protein
MTQHDPLLVVDDNDATRLSLRQMLERRGYRVLEASSGAEGLALLGKRAVAAVVLDIDLPDMSGLDIVRDLRSRPGMRLLPVIHVSAPTLDKGNLIAGLDAGADAYLVHPVEPDMLLATLRTLLRVRKAEEALRESEARFRDIFVHAMAPMAVIGKDMSIHDANVAFARLLGEGNHPRLAFEPGQEETLARLRRHLTAQAHWRGTLAMRIGKAVRHIDWRIAPYRAPDLALAFLEDITEQRQREHRQAITMKSVSARLAHEVAERERTESQLHQALKMDALGKLTGGIAHDFNNLLTTIVTSIEMVSRQIAGGRLTGVQRLADMALDCALRAGTLTHRLLAFARQQPLAPKQVNVTELVRSLEELLRRTIGEHITLEFELTDADATANVDASQLDNAIINLVVNARDAMPDGGAIRVTTSVVKLHDDDELPDGDYVQISVLDNGVGIEPEVLERVFEPFFTTKPIGKGTGLGLSMIYGFSRQSGGRASIHSQRGVGTEVRLLLPRVQAHSEVEPEALAIWVHGKGERILLVEDNETLRQLAHDLLSDVGYECTQAHSVEAAMEKLRSDDPLDLLLTDVGLPGMNGRQLADAARMWRPALPILFMTGHAEGGLLGDETADRRMDVLVKPFRVDQLLGKVRQILD